MQKIKAIVTKEYLLKQLEIDPVKLVGRALVAIFNYQTSQEKDGNSTVIKNGQGFTQGDARIGSLGAKYYLKHKTLEPWQLKVWTSLNKKGQPRIVKYADQLNTIAIRKKIATEYGTGRLNTNHQPVMQNLPGTLANTLSYIL